MNIGFDLDEVFVSHPPFIPSSLILKLYGEKANGKLTYRIPGKLEQFIRKLSHFYLLRPSIKANIQILDQHSHAKSLQCILISSRYGFLQKETDIIMQKYHLYPFFRKVYFNSENQQPHLFKEKILDKEKLDRYVDDDLPLLKYLAKKNPKVRFYWLNTKVNDKLTNNLFGIVSLNKIFV